MTNSVDPDQLASSEANWSGSTLFAKTGHVVFSKRRANFCLYIHIHIKAYTKACMPNGSANRERLDQHVFPQKSWAVSLYGKI